MNKDTLETLLEEFAPEYADKYTWLDGWFKYYCDETTERQAFALNALAKAAMFDELVITLALVNASLNEHIRRFTNPEFEGFAKAEKTLSKANRIKGVIDDE